jgi:LCP family protein required for cell wall assembly
MANFDAIQPAPHHFPDRRFAPPQKKRSKKWKWLFLILILLGGLAFGATRLLSRTNQIFTGNKNIFQRLSGLFISPDKHLTGEDLGTVNILLMGVGGNGHDGAYLTDTMIVASINSQTHEVILTSIPRDFAFDLPKLGYNKINAAYAYAYRDDPNTAGDVAIAAAEKVTGLTIPYYAVIDFKGFVKAVNDVGGVDVTVDHTFTDATFPNDYPYDTKGYIAPVTFTKGPAHMDGFRALVFARSRHSEQNNEGSDFARSERQKKILVALREKVLSLNLANLATINNLLTDFTQNFRTNLEPYELKRLGDIAKNIPADHIYSFSLEPQNNLICSALVDPKTGKRVVEPPPAPAPLPTPTPAPAPSSKSISPKPTSTSSKTSLTPTPNPVPAPTPAPAPILTPTPTDTAPEIVRMYVVQPCEGKTLADIQDFVRNSTELAKLKKEGAVVEVQNSTGKPYATSRFKLLADMGITVRYSTFLGKVPYDHTIFYDNSHGGKGNSLEYLKSNYNFTPSDVNYPASDADFVIVIGKDAL